MGLFSNRQQAQAISERQLLEKKYTDAYRNIYIVLVMTVINMVLLLTDSGRYFLFSASVPYLLVSVSWAFYGEIAGGLFYVLIGIAALILLMYLLCGIFAGKGRKGWLVFALVMFALDSLVMLLLGIGMNALADSIFDLVIHAMVLYSFISGISAANKLAKMPPEEEPTENIMDAFVQPPQETAETGVTEE